MDQKVTIITTCPNCGARGIEGSYCFCTQCAHDLRPYRITLPCCGVNLLVTHEVWNYCPFCGAKDPIGLAEA